MASSTPFPLKCDCGHTGNLMMKENDAPFSRQWEQYSLQGFKGGTYQIEGMVTLEVALREVKPICPNCGKLLTKDNLA